MKRLFANRFIILFLMMCMSVSIKAQKKDSSGVNAKNTIYFEMIGHGGLYSVNYERVFHSKSVLRGGLSYLNTSSDAILSFNYISIPLSASKLFPTDKDSFFEIGMFTSIFFHFDYNDLDSWIGINLGFREQDLFEPRRMVRFFVSPFYIPGSENKFGLTGGLAFGSGF
ncbi:MAG: hypothetical protein ABJI33_14680 [Balneola sp.]